MISDSVTGPRRLSQALLFAAARLLAPESRADDGRIPLWEPTAITVPGSYVVTRDIGSGGVVLDIQVSGVTVDLNGFTLESTSTTDPVVRIESLVDAGQVTDVELRSGYVVGGRYNVFAPNSLRLRIDDAVLRDAAEDCVHAFTLGVEGILLSMDKSFCWKCGQAGVKTGSDGVSYVANLDRLAIADIGGAGIDMTNARGSCIGSVTMNNVGTGILAKGSNGVRVRDVTIADATGAGAELVNSDGFNVTRMEIYKAGDDCLRLDFGSDSNRIANGLFSACLGEGVELQGSRNVLAGNSATDNASFGYLILGGLGTHVRGNDADQNAGDVTTCANSGATADYCDDGSATKSDGSNLLPGPC